MKMSANHTTIHDLTKHIESAKERKKARDRMCYQYKKRTGNVATISTPLTDEQVDFLTVKTSEKPREKTEPKEREKSRVEGVKGKPKEPETRVPFFVKFRPFLIDLLCGIIVIGHGFLVWFDCWNLWGIAGLIGGGVSFFVICLAFLLSTDTSKNVTSEYAVWFVFFVDCAAWKVHFDTFTKSASTSEMVTGVLCFFLCACSFIALFLFRHSKNN